MLKILIVLICGVLFAGCTGVETTLLPTPQAYSLATQPSTPVLRPGSTIYAPEFPTPGSPPTLQTSPSPTIQATPLPEFKPCSPLMGFSLQELSEIVSDPYRPPPMGKDDRHQGVDFSHYRRGDRLTIEGVDVQAVLPGRVAASVADSFPFGNLVIIETPGEDLPLDLREKFSIQEGESLYILYAHMLTEPELVLGEAVLACRVLGQVGKSGNAGVAHLHLEMRHGPAQVQFPVMAYYLAQNTEQERQNYLRWATSGEFLHFDPMEFLSD